MHVEETVQRRLGDVWDSGFGVWMLRLLRGKGERFFFGEGDLEGFYAVDVVMHYYYVCTYLCK